MWQILADHLGTILTLIGAAAGLIGMWAKMGFKLNTIEKDVLENREEMRSAVRAITERHDAELLACKTEHSSCRQATILHHENAAIHLQPDRWQDFANRLTRIETLLMHIRDNGK